MIHKSSTKTSDDSISMNKNTDKFHHSGGSIDVSGIMVGGDSPVRIMGILNTSPESFYKNSISTSNREIRDAIKQLDDDGSDFIDIGGMSTAPYLKTMVSESTEKDRVINAIKIAVDSTNLPISVDTCRSSVARAALKEGATILNDISGLQYDPKMPDIISGTKLTIVLCAFSPKPILGTIRDTLLRLEASIEIAKSVGVDNIIVDPAIGFFRREGHGSLFTTTTCDNTRRDLELIKHLDMIQMGYPILVSVSNKSFIGNVLDRDSSDRLYGSIAVEAISTMLGADIIRTHNVRPTKDAVDIASAIRSSRV